MYSVCKIYTPSTQRALIDCPKPPQKMISIAETLVPHYAVWPLLLLLLGTLGTVLKRNYSVSGTVRTKKNELKKYELDHRFPSPSPSSSPLFILST